MTKPLQRVYSKISRHALTLLGRQIRLGRKERKMTAQELADRAGLSRSLVQRIENGDPGCQIGAVFEAATIVGVTLFSPDEAGIASRLRAVDDRLVLLPKHIHPDRKRVDDEF